MAKLVIAMQEKAEGNESIGTAWTETGLFDAETPVSEILAWAEAVTFSHGEKPRGKLMIRYADDQRKDSRP